MWAPQYRGLTAGLVLTITFVAVEALAVLTIMPRVARDLGGVSLYGWVFSAFMLASLVGAVAAGRDADRVGPTRAYLAGILLFGSGLAVAGLAPSMAVLVVGRSLQGLGAGAIPAIAYVAHMRANKRPKDVVQAVEKMTTPASPRRSSTWSEPSAKCWNAPRTGLSTKWNRPT